MRVFLYTTFALIAFACNSILCRLALRGDEADAAGFTAVRIASGAVTLIVISYFFSSGKTNAKRGTWRSAFFLFAYAVWFSLAYLGLTAGTGALILFGSVQVTMMALAIGRGERPSVVEWLGLAFALGGLVYLVLPGLASPPLNSSLLMAAAGMAWAAYTLRGRSAADALADTTGNFVRAVPMAVVLLVVFFPNLHLSTRGLVLAVLSGALASGIGYTVWYAALRHLTSTRAAAVQLAVPVIAAILGILILSEPTTFRLLIAGGLILGGIALVILGKRK